MTRSNLVVAGISCVLAATAIIASMLWRQAQGTTTTLANKEAPTSFGTVEKVKQPRVPEGAPLKFLISCRKPESGMRQSAQNAWQRQHCPLVWVLVGEQTQVQKRNAGKAQIAEKQTASAWCSGPMFTTDPPQMFADLVIIEDD